MFAVTVTFMAHATRFEQLLGHAVEQASNSLNNEPDCFQFDVCTSPERPSSIFLYERYRDRAAFDRHLQTDHFRTFSTVTNDLVASKTVETWAVVPSE